MLEQVDLALQLFGVILYRVVLADIHRPLSPRGNIVKVSVAGTMSAAAAVRESPHLHLVGRENEGSGIVEVHTDRAVCQSIPHSVLVAVVYPRDDEDFGIRELQIV